MTIFLKIGRNFHLNVSNKIEIVKAQGKNQSLTIKTPMYIQAHAPEHTHTEAQAHVQAQKISLSKSKDYDNDNDNGEYI